MRMLWNRVGLAGGLASGVGVLLLASALATPAGALPLLGDRTRIEVTQAFGAISFEPKGTATTNAIGEVQLPVTGGDLSVPLLEGTIEHLGSILSFATANARILLSDLVFDLTDLVATGTLTFIDGGGTAFEGDVTLFGLRACLASTGVDPCIDKDGSTLLNGFGMNHSGTLAAFMNQAFGTSFAQGDPFGVAHLDVRFGTTPAPGPPLALLLASAMATLAVCHRKSLAVCHCQRR